MTEANKKKQKQKIAVYIALFCSMMVLLLGFILHNNYNNSIYKKDIQATRAHLWARYLTLLFEKESDADALQSGMPAIVGTILDRDPGILEIQVLSGTKFLFHTDSSKINKRIDPEDAGDKETYDENTQVKFRLKKKNVAEKFLLTVDRKKKCLTLVEPILKSKNKAIGIVKIVYTYKKEIPHRFYLIILAGLAIFFLISLLIFYFKRFYWFITIPGVLVFLLVTLFIFGRNGVNIKQALLLEKTHHLETVSTVIVEQHREHLGEYIRLLKSGTVKGFLQDWESVILIRPGDEIVSTKKAQVIPVQGTGFSIRLEQDTAYAENYRKEFNRKARVISIVFLIGAFLVLFFILAGYAFKTIYAVKKHYYSYIYIFPSMVGMLVLVFFPFIYGVSMGFFRITHGSWDFVGLQNFLEILSDFHPLTPGNFYFTLFVTLMWTVVNVFLHVTIGLMLALVLNRPALKLKRLFRVLLILPWAIPNYITALIWKGMFHKQFGAINAFLQWLGVEPVSWFNNFWTAFAANVMTNTWLGFPFMMVISLGALQSIPGELYEAAEVDGASKWQQFKNITLPLLKPALFPAVVLGTIWTFNMFNIIYLVSNGAPNRSTDILITQAFRFAFEKFNWGYAAAYSIIIFAILLVYGVFSNRATKATEGVFD